MLTPTEWLLVRDRLAPWIAKESNYRGYIQVIFGPIAKPVLLAIPMTGGTPDECATFVVGACTDQGWSSTPSHLETLLAYLINVHGVAELAPLRARAAAQIDPLLEIYEAKWIVSDLPFFDRKELRSLSRELIEKSARSVLKISGESGWGRSYSAKFFDFLSEEKGGMLLNIAHAKIERKQAPLFSVEDLADALISPMGVTASLPTPSTSSYPAALTRFVLKHAVAKTGRWVFVLEGFGQQDVQDGVKEFIHVLAQQACSANFRRRVRVVLIDYPEAIPNVLVGEILEEALQPPKTLRREDVEECLVALDAKRKALGRTPFKAGEMGKVADGILADAPVDGKGRLEHVYQELIQIRDRP